MNQAALAQTAYGATTNAVRTDRGVEYQAFTKVTRALADLPSGPTGFADRIAAIHENRRLWQVLAADVLSDDNRLPVDLRASIFSLSQYVMRQSAAVLTADAPVAPLIDINTTIMRGLRPDSKAG